MNEFEVISPDKEDITLSAEVPPQYKHLLLRGANAFMANCSFGDMLFNHFAGDGFDIWKSNYHIHRDAKVIGRANRPVLEFTVMYENSFSIDWKDVAKTKLPYKLIEMYYAPYVDNTTLFKGGNRFTTVDFHFHTSLLDMYTNEFTLLGKFMEKVYKGRATRIFDGKQFSSPAIDGVVKEMTNYKFKDSLAPRYYDSYANILLILLLERISDFNPLARNFNMTDKEKAHEAKRLLTTEFGESYTIKQLCQKLQTNPYKLKTTFKYLFGVTIGKYKKSVLMEHAKILLQTTEYSMDEIAFRLGYNSQQSFSTAFRNHFHSVPTHFRKKR